MDDAKKDLYWVIFFLLILAVIWYFTGGPERPSSKSGPFLDKPQEKYSKEVKSGVEKIISGKTPPESRSALSQETAALDLKIGGAKQSDPRKEYVEIMALNGNAKPINITGWSLVGKIGLDISIGLGAYLPYSAQVNAQENIFLNKGGRAIIVTGESPIGTNFRVNKCTGYFAQFQTFYPSLPKECPKPSDENLPSNLNDKCLDYLEKLPRCTMQISIPPGLSSACQTYISEKINYKTCVEIHKNDSDFYKSEWRIYLGRKEELWKNKRETITLRDPNKKTIDLVSY